MEVNINQVPTLDLSFASQNLGSYQQSHDQQIQEDGDSGYGVQLGTELFKAKDLLRSGTPDTFIGEFSNRPDITFKCEKCGYFVNVINLLEHRKYHACLLLMKFKDDTLPESTDVLFKRRNQLIKNLQQLTLGNSPPDPSRIQQINEAYEYLKSNIEDTFEEFRQIQTDVNTEVTGVALNCSPSCAYAVGIASSQNHHWKQAMEDTRVYQDYFGEDVTKCYLGLFDGHNGHFAAETAAMELHRILLNEMRKFDPATKSTIAVNMAEDFDHVTHRPMTQESERASYHNESVKLVKQILDMCETKYKQVIGDVTNSEKIDKKKKSRFKTTFSERLSEAFKKSYQLLDILLSYGKDEHSKVRWSGCSALTLVIQDTVRDSRTCDQEEEESLTGETPQELGLIHLANAGNTHCLMVRGNHSYRLTKDHTPKNKKEQDRVVKSGCSINMSSKDCRVNGVLSTTRGLGNHGDPKLKKGVLVEPYTTCVPIDQYAQFLVMASNGVWEIFSDQEVASLLLKLLPCNQVPPPREMSESVELLLKETEKHNNHNSTVKFQDVLSSRKSNTTKTSRRLTERSVEMMTIAADLKTEVGSHCGDDVDQDSRLHDDEMISMPVNCNIPDHKPETQSDHRRELAKSMAEYLVQAALLAGSRDNITVMVTLLPGCGF